MTALTAVIVLGAASGVLYVRSRDHATPLSTAQALSRFRTEATAGGVPTTQLLPSTTATTVPSRPSTSPSPGSRAAPIATSPSRPAPGPSQADPLAPPGVYVYDTTGGEKVDVLGGASHTYPAQTTITLKREGCGLDARWDALRERWDERHTCLTEAGEEVREVIQYHNFFGHPDQRDLQCTGALARPANQTPGRTYRSRCANNDTVADTVAKVVGVEVISVGGQSVQTLHISSSTTVRGVTRGTQQYEEWIAPTNGLLVRRIATNDTDTDSAFGTAHYQERYEIDLTALTPRT